MRWKTRKPGSRHRRKHLWHRWFAWHPVRVPNGRSKQVVWLETIARKGFWHHDWYRAGWTWEYKIEVNDE